MLLKQGGVLTQAGRELLNMAVTGQSLILATNGLMVVLGIVFLIASVAITLAPKAMRSVDPSSVGH